MLEFVDAVVPGDRRGRTVRYKNQDPNTNSYFKKELAALFKKLSKSMHAGPNTVLKVSDANLGFTVNIKEVSIVPKTLMYRIAVWISNDDYEPGVLRINVHEDSEREWRQIFYLNEDDWKLCAEEIIELVACNRKYGVREIVFCVTIRDKDPLIETVRFYH